MSVAMRRLAGWGMIAAGFVGSAGAQQKAMPDAQVEANVLRALAGSPELSTQDIHTTTVYGVVTLSGSAVDEVSRTKAENLAARADGVKKVVDELTLGGSVSARSAAPVRAGDQAPQLVLQSDGTYAPAGPDAPQESQPPSNQQATAQQPYPQQAPYPQEQPYPQQAPYPQQQARYPQQQQEQPYPQQSGQPPYDANNAPPQPPYPAANQRPYPSRRPMYGDPNGQNGYANGANAYPSGNQSGYPSQGGQVAGKPVTVPSGVILRIRINQGLSTKHVAPGEVFDGTVLTDVTADGAVAIPRGAAVQGTVVEAKDAGALKGRGELALQLTKLTMGGQTYVLSSDVWKEHGQDKGVRTLDSALGLGALGAIIGGVAGGGSGAAIGAGVGAGAGVASSAASPGGKVIIPPEAVLTFHLAQATTVATLSEQEMSRLSYAAGPNNGQPVVRRRAYPQPYYAPYGPYYGPRY